MPKPKLTKEIINERIMDRGIELVGEYNGVDNKAEFRCKCGYKWLAGPSSVMAGRGCPSCGGKLPLSKDIINERLLKSCSDIRQIGEYNGIHAKTTFQCKCGYEWSSTPQNILHGRGCKNCSGWLRELSKDIVNDRIKDRGIEQIGDYTMANDLSDFRCVCGYNWRAKPGNIMAGKGCPKCAKYGYQIDKPGWIYILIFETFIKYGITNDLDRRLFEHLNNGQYTVALTKLYEDGDIALKWEKNIKIIFGGRFVTKEIMPDGWTETLCVSKLELLMETVK